MTSALHTGSTTRPSQEYRRSSPDSPTRAYRASLRFSLTRLLVSMGIFFVIYLVFAWGMPLAMFALNLAGTSEPMTGQSPLFIPTMLYAVIASAIFINVDFKLFVQFGFSRKRILALHGILMAITSALLAFFTAFLEWLTPLVYVRGSHERLQLIGIAPYANGRFSDSRQLYSDNYAMIFVLCFFAYFLACALGATLGILLERLGTFGKFVFVALLVGIAIGALSFLSYGLNGTQSQRFFDFVQRHVLGIEWPTFHAGTLIVSMLVITAVLYVVIYLLNRRREVKRVNA